MEIIFDTIILSGGLSSRMPEIPKAFLRIGRQTSLDHIIETYMNAGVRKCIVVMNSSILQEAMRSCPLLHDPRVSVLINRYPQWGRTHSIMTGIRKCTVDLPIFIQNVDNPGTTTNIIRSMLLAVTSGGYVIPSCGGKNGHPLLLSPEIVYTFCNTRGRQENMRDFLKPFPQRVVHTNDKGIHWNINTPEEYKNYITCTSSDTTCEDL